MTLASGHPAPAPKAAASMSAGNAPRRWRPSGMIGGAAAVHAGALAAAIAVPATVPWAVGAVLASHAALAASGLWPRSRWLGPNLLRLPPSMPGRIALTFDDGPDPELTPRVLDLLDLHGARATFFCIGERARRYPELVEAIVARGHAVENHTLCHRLDFSTFGPAHMQREIAAAQQLLTALTG